MTTCFEYLSYLCSTVMLLGIELTMATSWGRFALSVFLIIYFEGTGLFITFYYPKNRYQNWYEAVDMIHCYSNLRFTLSIKFLVSFHSNINASAFVLLSFWVSNISLPSTHLNCHLYYRNVTCHTRYNRVCQ